MPLDSVKFMAGIFVMSVELIIWASINDLIIKMTNINLISKLLNIYLSFFYIKFFFIFF